MKKTIGNSDKTIRIILAAVLVALIFIIPLIGLWIWIAAIAALALFITALSGYCLLYSAFGISTCKAKPKQ